MNRSMQDDFKRDGLVTQILRKISDLEEFEREFRLKQFGAGGGGVLWLPWGIYVHTSPMSVNPSFPYGATVDRDMTLVNWTQALKVDTTNDANNYWSIELHTLNAGAGFPTINTISTVTLAIGTWSVLSDNTFTTTAITAATDLGLYIRCVKAGAGGAPGNLSMLGPALEITVP